MGIKEHTFKSERLERYKFEIKEESEKVIQRIIRKNSPILEGELVYAVDNIDNFILVKVTKVMLMAKVVHNTTGQELSFYYEGIEIDKETCEPKKGKVSFPFYKFTKDLMIYETPSYERIPIVRAKLH